MKKWVYAISAIMLSAFVWLQPTTNIVYAEGTATVSEGDATTGEGFDSAIPFELGEEVSVSNAESNVNTTCYRFEITEPGEYILEANIKQFNYTVHKAEGAPVIYSQIKGNSFYLNTSPCVEYAGDVIVFETAGTYYISISPIQFFTEDTGSFSLQKADITSMVLDNTVSTGLITEQLTFYKFVPEQTGRYCLTFNTTASYEISQGGYSSSGGAGERTNVFSLEAGITYYYCLKSDEQATFTVHIEKLPEVTAMEVIPAEKNVLYTDFYSTSYGWDCGCHVTLDDGSEEDIYFIDTFESSNKYGIVCKYYTADGQEVSSHLGLDAGKYYFEFVLGDIVTEPVYFEVKNKEDCDLVLKAGETVSDLSGDSLGNSQKHHLIKLVLEEAGKYKVSASCNAMLYVYDGNRSYENIIGKEIGSGTRLVEVSEPKVYYVYTGAEEKFNVSCTELQPLKSLEVSNGYRKNYISDLSDNAILRVLRELKFKALDTDGKEITMVYDDADWFCYELSYTLYNSKDKENPITETTDLPIGDYIIQISDTSGKVYCEVDFSVISPKDVSNALKVGEAVKLTGEYENYYLELTEADSLYVEYGEGTAVNHQIRIYSSDLETNYKTLSTTNKKELEAGKYFVRVLNGTYPDSCTFTIKGNVTDAPTTSDDVETQLDNIMDLAATAEEKVSKIIETLKLDELCKAMQQKISILVQISDLEKQYIADKKIEVTEPEVTTKKMDKHKIKTVGAGLNADKGKVTLSVTDSTQKVEIPADKYHNTVALDIKLKVNDVTMSLLKIPVTITMPIPAELMEEDLVILHYASDGSVAEVIYPTINGEDKTFSFAVTHFSTFVLANEKDGASNDTDVNTEEADTNEEEDADEGEVSATEKRLISPKTGEPDMAGYMVMLVLSLAALIFCMKKIRA